jgi:hypothetical protein
MQRLPLVDDIEDPIGSQSGDPIGQRREVGRRVKRRAIGLGKEERRHGLPVARLRHRNDDCAVAVAGDAFQVLLRSMAQMWTELAEKAEQLQPYLPARK